MTQETVFIRLLDVPAEDKGVALQAHVAAVNGDPVPGNAASLDKIGDRFAADSGNFSKIPKSPFAYWVSESMRNLYSELTPLETPERLVRMGDHPDNQDKYIRLWWEVLEMERTQRRQWIPYQKGGVYSLFYGDIPLLVDWDLERETYYGFHGRPGRSNERPSNYDLFFRPGLTWPRRTNEFGMRVMPRGCVFADKGPVVLVEGDDSWELWRLLAVLTSKAFESLVKLQLARTELARSYNVGLVGRTPVPGSDDAEQTANLITLAQEAYALQIYGDHNNENSHVFGVPVFVPQADCVSLHELNRHVEADIRLGTKRLEEVQNQIDELAFELYGLSEDDSRLVSVEVDRPAAAQTYGYQISIAERTHDLLMWCVGVAFGRWDVRKALDPSLLPALGEPFDPLPQCAPGALMGEDGLPLSHEHLPADYPLPIAWDGILVDDPTHPSDIVSRVRAVLHLLWGDRSNEIEAEACEILSVESLRDYFRDPRKFFAFHIKRYSKSRRRAPIYWLLQSEHRAYGIWLYYHRLNASTLYTAGRDYADVKVNLEQDHLTRRKEGLARLEGADLRRRQRQIDHQERVLAEVTAFRNALDKIALQDLAPDLNDGVVISIAPLHELAPWSYAERTWGELVRGDHDWSTMAGQMRAKGLVRSKEK